MMGKMNTKHQDRVTHKLKAQVTHLFLQPSSFAIQPLLRQLEQEAATGTDGEQRNRNVSSSSLLQKYTHTKGCVEAQTETNP